MQDQGIHLDDAVVRVIAVKILLINFVKSGFESEISDAYASAERKKSKYAMSFPKPEPRELDATLIILYRQNNAQDQPIYLKNVRFLQVTNKQT